MEWVYNDGGRKAAGRKGDTGDCVTRAIAIATGLPYLEVYDVLAEGNKTQRRGKHDKKGRTRSASNGINTKRKWFKDYMKSLGFEWVAVMGIGTGCIMHLHPDEIPMGTIIAKVSRHYVAVIDGVVYDTYDPSRNGNRCVYGYWRYD